MNCPDCQSTNIIKRGIRSGETQEYSCKACGRRFTGKPNGRPKVLAGACPKCGSGETKKIGHRDPAKKRIYCRGCGKTSVCKTPEKTIETRKIFAEADRESQKKAIMREN